MSSVSRSKINLAKFGESSGGDTTNDGWTSKLRFYPNVDLSQSDPSISPLVEWSSSTSKNSLNVTGIEYEQHQLLSDLCQEFPPDEQILGMLPFRNSIIKSRKFKLTTGPVHHKYLLFVTNKGYHYTIEKMYDCILLQRSIQQRAVRKYWEGEERLGCKTFQGKFVPMKKPTLMRDLIQWIVERKELDKGYQLMTANCQHFAYQLNNHFTECHLLWYTVSINGFAYSNDFRVSPIGTIETLFKMYKREILLPDDNNYSGIWQVITGRLFTKKKNTYILSIS